MSTPEVSRVWGSIRTLLQSTFSFYDIKEVVGLAGINLSELSHLEQKQGGGASKGQLMTAIDKSFDVTMAQQLLHCFVYGRVSLPLALFPHSGILLAIIVLLRLSV